jgi:transposase
VLPAVSSDSNQVAALLSALSERDIQLAEAQAQKEALKSENARLWKAYEQLKEELALCKRRMFIATAERVDTTSLQLEFSELVQQLDKLAGDLESMADDPEAPRSEAQDGHARCGDRAREKTRKKSKPKGRRNLADSDLPQSRVEIPDDLFESLVAQGKAERIGFEESSKLGYERGGFRHLVVARVKYRAVNAQGASEMETAQVPKELMKRALAAPSTLAHIATNKFCDGLPLYRQQDILCRQGVRLCRGTMSRWMEELGATFGATIVEAMRQDALHHAFCILTDSTGFCVQPGRFEDPKHKLRRPCKKGHYYVQIADRDHILFEFVERNTSQHVRALFRGFEGYVQADAASVFDALFRPSDPDDPDDDGASRTEVGCWAHCRRKYWEAALCKERVAREALVRLGKMFEVDEHLRQGRPPPSKIKKLRDLHLRPLVEEFIAFAQTEYDKVKGQRGSLRSALGYTVRQAKALEAFLQDGRLRMDNNPSEAELRKVVRIRDAALFAGSEEHAQRAGHILSLIASAKLHHLDPEQYLRDIIRVLPHWPRDRYLGLSPKHWAATRKTLDPAQLIAELGALDVPDHPTPGGAERGLGDPSEKSTPQQPASR